MQTKFEQFEHNVIDWANERGIFAHSNFKAQIAKGLSEAGELADALIKKDRNALRDAIGDVAVCIVNANAFLPTVYQIIPTVDPKTETKGELESLANVVVVLGTMLLDAAYADNPQMLLVITLLDRIARLNGMTLIECCEAAWNEIKDRKGHMVEGGAFVKEPA